MKGKGGEKQPRRLTYRDAGVDIGVMGKNESCCGGRAHQWGYRKELNASARRNARAWIKAGVKTVVTPCAECYYTFNRLYRETGLTLEVVHLTEYIDRLIKKRKIKLTKSVPLTVPIMTPVTLAGRESLMCPGRVLERRYTGRFRCGNQADPDIPGPGAYTMPRGTS